MDKKPTPEELLIEAMNVLQDLAVSAQVISDNNEFASYNTHNRSDLHKTKDHWTSLRADLAKAKTLVRDHRHLGKAELSIIVGVDHCKTVHYSNVFMTVTTEKTRGFICPSGFDALIHSLCCWSPGMRILLDPNLSQALTALGFIVDHSPGGFRGTNLLKKHAKELINAWKKRYDEILNGGGISQ